MRPALLLADAGRGDWVLCQITSRPYADPQAITLTDADFVEGSLQRISFARASKLFTAHESLFQSTVATLKPEPHAQVVEGVVSLLRGAA